MPIPRSTVRKHNYAACVPCVASCCIHKETYNRRNFKGAVTLLHATVACH